MKLQQKLQVVSKKNKITRVLLRPLIEGDVLAASRTMLSRGMTLIEIILVVALLGTLMAYLVRNLLGTADNAKIDTAKLAMGQLQGDLQMYRVHNNKFPTTEQGLDALLTAPGDAKGWRGPYTEASHIQDPWGVKFTYESDGRNTKIISAGPDGQPGTADDISYPEAPADSSGGGTKSAN